ncbi:hypothetical protein HaLaN_17684 [Haematococcus lacustris]|uniref:Uncharacterized protein n=1 Tax=Haematococcus lacustris TaxID=44745 RepID=A0A699ZP75_HAELA|nr:hypothetical protein HaLaN_17684 [Haematococcus lacustris]
MNAWSLQSAAELPLTALRIEPLPVTAPVAPLLLHPPNNLAAASGGARSGIWPLDQLQDKYRLVKTDAVSAGSQLGAAGDSNLAEWLMGGGQGSVAGVVRRPGNWLHARTQLRVTQGRLPVRHGQPHLPQTHHLR